MLRRLFFHLKYFTNPPWDTGISPPELMEFIRSHPPGRALDIGCGTGTNVITLARNGWQAVGVDFAPRAIAIGNRKLRQAGVQATLQVGDATRLQGISGPFNLILDIGCLHSLPPAGHAGYLNNLERLLAPRGAFLIYTFVIAPGAEGPGVTEDQLKAIDQVAPLVHRQNGTERGIRPSSWLTFRKPE